MVDIEELEQYGRRNSLRFHNIPITKEELNKNDYKIVDICKQHLKIDITPDDINRSHIIGKIHREGSCKLICRFRGGKIKNQIFTGCGCCDSLIESIFSPSGPENNFTRFASGVIFSSFIVLFTFDGVAILKYITVVHKKLKTDD
jgi:hypothetical protein